jgi:hypothetical protein
MPLRWLIADDNADFRDEVRARLSEHWISGRERSARRLRLVTPAST